MTYVTNKLPLPERNSHHNSSLSYNSNSTATAGTSSSIIIVTFLHQNHRTDRNRSRKKHVNDIKTAQYNKKDHNNNDDEENNRYHKDLMSFFLPVFSQNNNTSKLRIPIDSASTPIQTPSHTYPNITSTSTSTLQQQQQQQTASSSSSSTSINTFPMGLIIDHHNNNNNNNSYCHHQHQQLIDTINHIRSTLPLDSKRPTVNRRFYHDTDLRIVQHLERIVYDALTSLSTPTSTTSVSIHDDVNHDNSIIRNQQTKTKKIHYTIYCNRYLRILEYNTSGIGLPPHTDGIKICDTTQHHSTHTLLFYLSNCRSGGETVIMMNPNSNNGSNTHKNKNQSQQQTSVIVPSDRIYQLPISLNIDQRANTNTNMNMNTTTSANEQQQKHEHEREREPQSNTYYHHCIDVSHGWNETNICLGISPKIGRIVLFPHTWTHAGAICTSIPKIMLRAEMTIQYSFD
jgi:hypothetical protein